MLIEVDQGGSLLLPIVAAPCHLSLKLDKTLAVKCCLCNLGFVRVWVEGNYLGARNVSQMVDPHCRRKC